MFKKKDIVLICCLISIAAICYLLFNLSNNGNGGYVKVIINGKVTNEYSLKKNKTFTIKQDRFINTFEVKDGYVFMTDANCPDKYCVKHNKISKNKEVIVCLPHKLVLEICDDKDKSSTNDNNKTTSEAIDGIVK